MQKFKYRNSMEQRIKNDSCQVPSCKQQASNDRQIQKEEQQKSIKQKYKWEKKEQPLIMFFLCILIGWYITVEVYIFFVNTLDPILPWENVFGDIVWPGIAIIVVLLLNSYIMTGFKGMFYTYTFLDIGLILALCSAVVFISFQLVVGIPTKTYKYDNAIASYVIKILQYFCYIGNFRIMLITGSWVKWRVILFKFHLYSCCFFYIAYGVYYQYYKTDYNDFICQLCDLTNVLCENSCIIYGNATDCCYDLDNLRKYGYSKVNQFFLIYLATGLAFSTEMVAYVSEFDGTAELDIHYTIYLDSNEQQVEKINQQQIIQEQNAKNQKSIKQVEGKSTVIFLQNDKQNFSENGKVMSSQKKRKLSYQCFSIRKKTIQGFTKQKKTQKIIKFAEKDDEFVDTNLKESFHENFKIQTSKNNLQNMDLPCQISQIKDQQDQQDNFQFRKQQPLILYILCIICSIYSTIQVYVFLEIIFSPNVQSTQIFVIIIGTGIGRIIIFGINSFYMIGWKEVFYVYTLLDVLGVFSYCVVGMYLVFGFVVALPLKLLKDQLVTPSSVKVQE